MILVISGFALYKQLEFKVRFCSSQATTLSSMGCIGHWELDVWFAPCALVSVPSTESYRLVTLQQDMRNKQLCLSLLSQNGMRSVPSLRPQLVRERLLLLTSADGGPILWFLVQLVGD